LFKCDVPSVSVQEFCDLPAENLSDQSGIGCTLNWNSLCYFATLPSVHLSTLCLIFLDILDKSFDQSQRGKVKKRVQTKGAERKGMSRYLIRQSANRWNSRRQTRSRKSIHHIYSCVHQQLSKGDNFNQLHICFWTVESLLGSSSTLMPLIHCC